MEEVLWLQLTLHDAFEDDLMSSLVCLEQQGLPSSGEPTKEIQVQLLQELKLSFPLVYHLTKLNTGPFNRWWYSCFCVLSCE